MSDGDTQLQVNKAKIGKLDRTITNGDGQLRDLPHLMAIAANGWQSRRIHQLRSLIASEWPVVGD
jgi:hypothetical protein